MTDADRDYQTYRNRLARFLWNVQSTDEEAWTRDEADYERRANEILNREYGYMEAAAPWRQVLAERETVEKYRTEFDLVDAEVRLADVDRIMEKLREHGYPELVRSGPNDVPIAIEIVFHVGPEEIAADLWELHGVVGEVEAELSSFTSQANLGKPELMVRGE